MQPFPAEEEPFAYSADDNELETAGVDLDAAAPEILPDSPEWPVFKEAAKLVRRKYELAKELKALNKELSRVQPLVINYFEQRSLWEGVVIEGFRLYTRSQLWARVKNDQMKNACAAMKATGLGHFVHESFNSNTFSAHVRQLQKDNEDRIQRGEITDVSILLPAVVANTLNITTDITLMGVKSSKGKK